MTERIAALLETAGVLLLAAAALLAVGLWAALAVLGVGCLVFGIAVTV